MMKIYFLKMRSLFLILVALFSIAFWACNDKEEVVTEFALSPSTLSVEALTQTTIKAVVKVAGNISSESEIIWGSNDQEVATVDNNGVVSTHVPGKVTITAVAEGKSASCFVTVTPSTAVAQVIVTPSEASITVGGELSLTSKLSPENAVGTVVWSSADTEIATVDATTGAVIGVGVGATDIIATAGGKTGTCRVSVNEVLVLSGITVEPTSGSVFVGGSFALTASLLPIGIEGEVSWSSKDETIATVNSESGIVTGISEGSATITATSGEFSATSTITVTQDINGYAPTRAFYPGAAVGLPVKMTTYKGVAKFSYVSDDESVAKVIDDNGVPRILLCGDGSGVSSNEIYDKKTIVNVIVKNELNVVIAAVKINVRSSFCGFGLDKRVNDFGTTKQVDGDAQGSKYLVELKALYYKDYYNDEQNIGHFLNYNLEPDGTIIKWTPGVQRLPSKTSTNLTPDVVKHGQTVICYASNDSKAAVAYYQPNLYMVGAINELDVICAIGNDSSGTVTRKFTVKLVVP